MTGSFALSQSQRQLFKSRTYMGILAIVFLLPCSSASCILPHLLISNNDGVTTCAETKKKKKKSSSWSMRPYCAPAQIRVRCSLDYLPRTSLHSLLLPKDATGTTNYTSLRGSLLSPINTTPTSEATSRKECKLPAPSERVNISIIPFSSPGKTQVLFRARAFVVSCHVIVVGLAPPPPLALLSSTPSSPYHHSCPRSRVLRFSVELRVVG